MNSDLSKSFEEIPLAIDYSSYMTQPNEPISIHDGNFRLISEKQTLELKGKVWLDWFPEIATKFSGLVIDSHTDSLPIISDEITLVIEGLRFGTGIISQISYGGVVEIWGEIIGIALLGDRSVIVPKVTFSVLNLRNFNAKPVKSKNDEGGINLGNNRLILENEDYIITIDKRKDYNEIIDKLNRTGGYSILYSGQIIKKTGKIYYEELIKIHLPLSFFLTFLNGQRCYPILIKGIYDDMTKWTDCTAYTSDPFKHVYSWPSTYSIDGINEIWNEFLRLWKNENDKDFLISVLHWYIEANKNTGYIEGSIIMIQTALELIFNYLVIEKRKLIYGKDCENISASNKIRILLSQIKAPASLPKSLLRIKSFMSERQNAELPDGIELFVQIRNSIIHSQLEKRKKMSKIPHLVKYEAQQLGLWYIELSLLHILGFKGKYRNRCSGELWLGKDEEIME